MSVNGRSQISKEDKDRLGTMRSEDLFFSLCNCASEIGINHMAI